MTTASDTAILRDLATRYMELCQRPVQDERRDLWRRHNSLQWTRPLVFVRAFAWGEMEAARCACEDPLFRGVEGRLRQELFRAAFDDDYVFEPWLTLRAVHTCRGWGVDVARQHSEEARGSFKVDYPLKELDDIDRLRVPWHEIDEARTAETRDRVAAAIGDILPVVVDRGPAYRVWSGDLSTDLGYLRGIEHFMMDMLDHPQWLHRLTAFLSEGVQKTHAEAEHAGDWSLVAHENQAIAYAEELDDPAADDSPVNRDRLWGYMAAQEFTAVSPAMHDEFLLQYQLPILEPFGLVAYGCCEDLTHKIDMLRQIPNLRRIAVSPFADVATCAAQIQEDYVLSYRPSPADMVGYGLDEDRVRSILTRDLEAARGTHMDITLKDVETVEHDPDRIRNWVALTRKVIDEVYG